MSEDDFIQSWTKTVATQFNLDQQELLKVFTQADTHDTNWRTREHWKYGASNGMHGTPQGFVNGVFVENYPQTVADWQAFFKDLYDPEDFLQ